MRIGYAESDTMNSMKPLNIIAFAGSLRKNSYNRSLMRHVKALAPETVEITIVDLIDIPLYNGDVEDAGTPQSVLGLKDKIKNADGVLIATPEYNWSISGVLKNTLDWISRDPNTIAGKPVAIIGGSDGGFGTSRAQKDAQALLLHLEAFVMGHEPRLLVSNVDKKIDENGEIIDEKLPKTITKFLSGYEEWVRRFQ